MSEFVPVQVWSPASAKPAPPRPVVTQDLGEGVVWRAPSPAAPQEPRLAENGGGEAQSAAGGHSVLFEVESLSKSVSHRPKPQSQGKPDDFQTPPEAVAFLLPYLDRGWRIWEPAVGAGNIVRALSTAGIEAIGSDILGGQDFRTFEPVERWDAIVTNPPFSIKNEWIARCYSLDKPWALLLPLTTLEGRVRQTMFAANGIEVLLLPSRPEFTTPSGKVGGSWFACAWFTWGLNIGRELTFTGYDSTSAQGSLF